MEIKSEMDAEQRLSLARQLCRRQAEDEALWFRADSIVEAYLQNALRQLTAVVEGDSTDVRWETP